MIDLERLVDELLNRPDLIRRLQDHLNTDGDLVSVPRAAELRGVSEKTIRNWIAAGRLDRHGTHRAPLVDRRQLMQPTSSVGGAGLFTDRARRG